MRAKSTFFILCLLFSITACNQAPVAENPSSDPSATKVDAPKKAEPVVDPASLIVGKEWHSIFEGSLGNGKIPIELDLQRHDNVLRGSLTYKSKGLPIRIYGYIFGENNFAIREYAKGTEVSGMLSGKIEKGQLNGNWYASAGESNYPLSVKASAKKPTAQEWPAATQTVAGVYSYSFPDDGGTGTLTVKQSGNDITFDAISVNGGPAYHIATIEGGKGKVVDHTVHYSMNGGACEFNIRFFKDFAYIEFVGEQYDCDFGMGASIEGIFVREPKR